MRAGSVFLPRSVSRVERIRAGLVLFAFAAACSADENDPMDAIDPQLTVIEQKLFTPSCALSPSCHGGANANGKLDLTAPVHERIVGRPSIQAPKRQLVVPGDPMASYLFEKVSSANPTVGERMPDGAPALGNGALEALRTWIERGAPAD